MLSNDRNISFLKMHGLGNDFVIIDSRHKRINLPANLIRKLGDRNFGVGFDQLGIIQNSEVSDAHLTFFNSDGSISATCGNATRCIANFLMLETKKDEIVLIHSLKTGKLIACSILLGQIGNSKENEKGALKAFGEKIGLAFQITDDILEVTSDKETLGT